MLKKLKHKHHKRKAAPQRPLPIPPTHFSDIFIDEDNSCSNNTGG